MRELLQAILSQMQGDQKGEKVGGLVLKQKRECGQEGNGEGVLVLIKSCIRQGACVASLRLMQTRQLWQRDECGDVRARARCGGVNSFPRLQCLYPLQYECV
jgi:hypothetical protein